MLPIGEFRQPRSGPLMLLLANSLDGVGGCLVSGLQPPRRDGVVSCPAERSSALCSAHSVSKSFRWRTSVHARQGSNTGALPNSPHAIPNHVGGVSSARTSAAPQLMGLSSRTSLICALRNLDAHPIWKKNHVRAVLNCPPTNRRSLFKNTENPA